MTAHGHRAPTSRPSVLARRTVFVPAMASALVIVLSLAGCGGSGTPAAPLAPVAAASSLAPSPAPGPSLSPSPSPSPSPSARPASSATSKRPTPPSTSRAPQTPASGHGPAGSQLVTGNSTVALTFDDGPDPVYTPKILALLRQYHVKATFCLIGSRARDYPDIVRQIVADGHSLCNHSWQHLTNLGQRDAAYREWDLTQTNLAIQNAAPGTQVKWFRAPGGNFTTDLVSQATSLGMGSVYWSIDPRDWDSATYGTGTSMVNHIVSTVEGQVRPGSIVLSHDRAHPDTITAYGILLPWLTARYQLAPL